MLTLAAGLSPNRLEITDSALELFRQFTLAREMFTPDATMHFLRVMGSSIGRIEAIERSRNARQVATDIAVPFEILITQEFAAQLPASMSVQPAGRRLLKGFDGPVELLSVNLV